MLGQLDRRRRMDVLVVVPDGGEQVGDVVVIQRVVGVPARAARPHQPQAAEDPQRGSDRSRAGGMQHGGGERGAQPEVASFLIASRL